MAIKLIIFELIGLTRKNNPSKYALEYLNPRLRSYVTELHKEGDEENYNAFSKIVTL